MLPCPGLVVLHHPVKWSCGLEKLSVVLRENWFRRLKCKGSSTRNVEVKYWEQKGWPKDIETKNKQTKPTKDRGRQLEGWQTESFFFFFFWEGAKQELLYRWLQKSVMCDDERERDGKNMILIFLFWNIYL